jgi:hypothetical protein
MQPKVVQSSHRTPEHISARLHCGFPSVRVDVEARCDRWEPRVDGSALVVANCATRPVDEFDVMIEPIGNRVCGIEWSEWLQRDRGSLLACFPLLRLGSSQRTNPLAIDVNSDSSGVAAMPARTGLRST